MPEADQHLDDDEGGRVVIDDSDSVETLHLSATEAFGKFKGKNLDSSNVDFSDRLRPSSGKHGRKGYVSWSGELELITDGDKETPMQKYQRLKCEMGELSEEVAELEKKAKDDGSSGDKKTLGGVASKVSGLLEELNKLKLEETLGSEMLKDLQVRSQYIHVCADN